MRFRILLLLLFFIACNQKETTSKSLLGYLPENPVLVAKINHLTNLETELNNTLILQELSSTNILKKITAKLKGIGQFDPMDESVIGFYEVGKNNYEFVMAADNFDGYQNFHEMANHSIETITYEKETIQKITLDDQDFFLISVGNKKLVTSSQILIENVIRAKISTAVSDELQHLYSTSKDKSATVFLNLNESSALAESVRNPEKEVKMNYFGDWMALDISNQKNNLHLNGVTIAKDSVKSFLNLFRRTLASPESIGLVAPKNTDLLLSFRFGDFNVLAQNQMEYLDVVKEPDTVLNTIEEVGILMEGNKKSVVLKSFGVGNLTDHLTSISSNSGNYQGYEILKLNQAGFLREQLSPLVKKFDSNYWTIIENYFIFAESPEVLQTLIANKNSGTTFNTSDSYRTANQLLPNESSLFFITKKGGISDLSREFFSTKLANDLKKAKLDDFAMAGQVSVDGDIFHTQIILNKIGVQRTDANVSPLLTVELDGDLANNPQFVKNHRNNKYEIAVQDKDRNLYLIDSEGKVLWKKQLEGLIRGKIHQVDLYRNGRLQMAFCTNDQFMVLDRNGEITKGIDKKYQGGNLNGLAVFDYENNRKYRMVVTQGKKVFMYDNEGKLVDGFTYKETESPIIKPPKHFRIRGKDYLVFQLENGKLKIRHRSGGERVKVNRTIDFSDNEVFLYLNKFSLTDKKGVLHQVDPKGKLSAAAFNLESDHGMFATSKTLALMNENVLSIKGKKIELELGVYSKPKIFYIYDKIYVAVTDIQGQKIYLFDSQAKAIPNFPVFGSSVIDMVDIEGDGKLELIAKDQENSIILYGIN